MWSGYASRSIIAAIAALLAALIPAMPRSAPAPLTPVPGTVDVAIRTARDLRDALDARGARIGSVLPGGNGTGGGVLTATIGTELLPDLVHLPGVLSVTVGDRLTPQLDQATSAAQIGASDVNQVVMDHLGRPVTGRGVLTASPTPVSTGHTRTFSAPTGARASSACGTKAPRPPPPLACRPSGTGERGPLPRSMRGSPPASLPGRPA